ncbi:hypothetical protein AB6A40_008419 [Gnathostoma spinigerum]|uniref:Uncharacterized protein n=1 Tax=Gnathostoma spinigerum TaxID=75299 RepID=A0ABD6EP09_9BILA
MKPLSFLEHHLYSLCITSLKKCLRSEDIFVSDTYEFTVDRFDIRCGVCFRLNFSVSHKKTITGVSRYFVHSSHRTTLVKSTFYLFLRDQQRFQPFTSLSSGSLPFNATVPNTPAVPNSTGNLNGDSSAVSANVQQVFERRQAIVTRVSGALCIQLSYQFPQQLHRS